MGPGGGGGDGSCLPPPAVQPATAQRADPQPALTTRSGRLAREVETFVDRFRSIPAFTANLTMELFQKQTQC